MDSQHTEARGIDLGRVSVWQYQLDLMPSAQSAEASAEIEELGYGAIWIPEMLGHESFINSTMVCSRGNDRIRVSTGSAVLTRASTELRDHRWSHPWRTGAHRTGGPHLNVSHVACGRQRLWTSLGPAATCPTKSRQAGGARHARRPEMSRGGRATSLHFDVAVRPLPALAAGGHPLSRDVARIGAMLGGVASMDSPVH